MKYAGIFSRLFAAIIDLAFFIPIYYAIQLPMLHSKFLALLLFCLCFAISILYPIVCIKLWGQTLGKFLFSIQVVNISGNNISWIKSIMRNIAISAILVIIGIFMLFILNSPTSFYQMADSSLRISNINIIMQIVYKLAFFTAFLWYFPNFVTMIFNKKHRTINDIIANTAVIRKEKMANRSLQTDEAASGS
jgi:uncharacterized RDD family membrane protein YckC